MDNVQVPIELQRAPRPPGIDAHDDRRGSRVSRLRPLDAKAVGREHGGQTVRCGTGLAGGTWCPDQPGDGFDQAVAVDCLPQALGVDSGQHNPLRARRLGRDVKQLIL